MASGALRKMILSVSTKLWGKRQSHIFSWRSIFLGSYYIGSIVIRFHSALVLNSFARILSVNLICCHEHSSALVVFTIKEEKNVAKSLFSSTFWLFYLIIGLLFFTKFHRITSLISYIPYLSNTISLQIIRNWNNFTENRLKSFELYISMKWHHILRHKITLSSCAVK